MGQNLMEQKTYSMGLIFIIIVPSKMVELDGTQTTMTKTSFTSAPLRSLSLQIRINVSTIPLDHHQQLL